MICIFAVPFVFESTEVNFLFHVLYVQLCDILVISVENYKIYTLFIIYFLFKQSF